LLKEKFTAAEIEQIDLKSSMSLTTLWRGGWGDKTGSHEGEADTTSVFD
jgi:hypothetical protein